MKNGTNMALVLMLALTPGCSGGSLVIKKPASPVVNASVDELWAAEIRRTARTGDWILSRSYSFNGDLIAGLSRGESLSHASLYDAERGTVIEAIPPVVREIPLAQFLARNHHVIVVRPSFLTAAEQRQAVTRARAQLGHEFDYAGMFGIGSADKFYCSELVVWASDVEAHGIDVGALVTPSSLMRYAEVIYYSGERTDAQLQAGAVERHQLRKLARH